MKKNYTDIHIFEHSSIFFIFFNQINYQIIKQNQSTTKLKFELKFLIKK
jgi:hypothetical protein